MSTQSEVRDFLIAEVKRISREKREEVMTQVQPTLNALISEAMKDREFLSLQQRVWQYYDKMEQRERLEQEMKEIAADVEREFKPLAKIWKVPELDLDSRHTYDEGGKYYDSCAEMNQATLRKLLTSMCLDEALERTGQKEAIAEIDRQCFDINRRVFLAMNLTALRKIAPDLKALGIELEF
jgi:hypothetical protein